MKKLLIRLFWPILALFEKRGDAAGYRPSHRKTLLAMGFLFFVLAGASSYFALYVDQIGVLIPIIFFFAVGLVCWVVGLLGSDAAVARIWGSR